MNFRRTKFPRFKDCNSEEWGHWEQRLVFRHVNKLLDGFRIEPGNKILDSRGPFLQMWNRIFLISCVFALALDPLFFYIPVIDVNKCLDSDNRMKIIASLLRTVIDVFYILHIILQFRTGFIAPSSRVLGTAELIDDPSRISRRYLLSYFFLDILAILPIPQVMVFVIIPTLHGPAALMTKESLKFIIGGQYVPRVVRIYPLYKEVTRTFGILHETAWAGAAFNLLFFLFASHIYGTFWYLFSIDRKVRCWHDECQRQGCDFSYLYCNPAQKQIYTFLDTSCPLIKPDEIKNSTEFNFGIYIDALRSGVVESKDFPKKLFYCSWWGFRNLSSLGQNLITSTFEGEIIFAFSIAIAGLVLYSLLIGNVQKNLLSTKVRRAEEMTTKRQAAEQDAEQWMLRRMLPEALKDRIRRYEQYKWQETRGVEEESLIRKLPKDLRRDIKHFLCLHLLMRVPMFEKMDEQLLDAMCYRLKSVLYTKSLIVHEGDPVNEMLFIIRGKLVTTTNGGRTGFLVYLKVGDFCGEELLTWALDPNSSSNLPTSTRTVEAITEVEAFAVTAHDLKFVASQFRHLHGKHLQQHTFRFYSQHWRTWAACFIQAAWQRHCKRKQDKALRDAEDWLHDALAKDGSASPSLAATLYASRFADKGLRNLRKSGGPEMPQRLPLLMPQKPAEPDFTAYGSN
ncbi:hypothetical protein BT93_E1130 [Corymbia citriodora subsp. variegata]|nr:hypothetical protein BT93_E1130 [Corymbia citriodora subsp. variegata]